VVEYTPTGLTVSRGVASSPHHCCGAAYSVAVIGHCFIYDIIAKTLNFSKLTYSTILYIKSLYSQEAEILEFPAKPYHLDPQLSLYPNYCAWFNPIIALSVKKLMNK
jgi:hypothetical protein